MSELVRHQLIIVAVAAIVLFTNLGGPRLWDRDEPRNAGCAAEMLDRNDWVVPVFNGELRTHKPILLYWLMMTSYALFGVNEFSARFWSAALGVATVLMTYHLGRRWFDAKAGFWAALTLAPALMFGVAARAATPDAVLIFCSTLAIFTYGMLCGPLVERGEYAIRWRHALVIYAAMGLAILAKGPVGLVLPTAVIGMFLLIMRQPTLALPAQGWQANLLKLLRPFAPLHFLRTCWSMRPLTAIGVSLAIALPWYLWVHYRTEGAWTLGFFLEHNLGRATEAMEGHRGNVLFYPAAIAVGFFPWSVFLAPMLIDTVQQMRQRRPWLIGYIFAACWVGVYVALFSLAKTKLPSYITPCYPGMALLMGAFMSRVARHEFAVPTVWLRVATGVSAVVGVVLLVALPVAAYYFLPGEEWLGVLGLAPLAAGILGWIFVSQQNYRRLTNTYAVAAVAFSTLLLALVPQRIDAHQHNDQLLAAIEEHSDHPQVGHFRHLEPTWVFYGGRPLVTVTTADDAEPLNREVTPVPGSRQWQKQPKHLLGEFLAVSPDRFIITTREAWESAKAAAPANIEILAEVPYFLRRHQLIVVGHRQEGVSTADRGRLNR